MDTPHIVWPNIFFCILLLYAHFGFFFYVRIRLDQPLFDWKNSDETRSNIGFKKSHFFQNQINMHTFYREQLLLACNMYGSCYLSISLRIEDSTFQMSICSWCVWILHFKFNQFQFQSSIQVFWLISWILCLFFGISNNFHYLLWKEHRFKQFLIDTHGDFL